MPTRKRSVVSATRPQAAPGDDAPTAVYPGSFDPITNGHIDIIRRALRVFPRITVAVAYNPNKDAAMFSPPERVAMIEQALADVGDRVIADSFTGLLVDYAERIGAQVLIRGLRAVSDFEYEFQMTMMNRHLKPKIETVFMMAGEQYFYTSSRLVKEVATFGGDVRNLVPDFVLDRFAERLTKKSAEKKRG
jgi:pantetheine-phosphate adenylyltransferase